MLDFKEACKLTNLDERYKELCERIECYPSDTLLDIAKGINGWCGEFADIAEYWEDLEAFCEGMDAYEAAEAVVNGEIQDCESPIREDGMGGYETFDPEEAADYQREEIAAWVVEHDNAVINGCLAQEERDLIEAWDYLDTYGEDLYEDDEEDEPDGWDELGSIFGSLNVDTEEQCADQDGNPHTIEHKHDGTTVFDGKEA